MKRVLIIAGSPFGRLDRSASEVADSIAIHHDASAVITVGAVELAAASWSYRIAGGKPSTTVRLKDGTPIHPNEIGAVLNLVRSFPQQVMFISFLRTFSCRVINNVDGQGPLGLHSPLRWTRLAHRCGIDTPADGIATGMRILTRRARPAALDAPSGPMLSNVTVVGDRVFGADTPMHARQCRRLARAAGCELLGLQFSPGPEHELVAADPFPLLFGRVADAVARLLCERAIAATERVA